MQLVVYNHIYHLVERSVTRYFTHSDYLCSAHLFSV